MFEDRAGKVGVVFGGTGAIGRAVCSLMVQEGAQLAFTCRSNRAGAAALAADIGRDNQDVTWEAVENEDRLQVAAFMAKVVERFGRIDSVIYAAGPDIDLTFISKVNPDAWCRAIDMDVNGCFHIIQAALPYLRSSQGSFTAVLTSAIERPPALDGMSSAPKAAVEAIVKTIAQEEGRHGVRANCVAPGFIDGGLGRKLLDTLGEKGEGAIIARTDLRRLGRAEEVADGVGFLSSRRASFVTGETLFISGGLRT